MGMQLRSSNIKTNVLLAAIGNGVFALTQWGIIAVLARLGSPAEVGALTISTALVTPIFFLSQMALRDGHTVDDLDSYTRADYIALRMLSSLLACFVSAIVVFVYLSSAGLMVQMVAISFTLVKAMGSAANLNYGVFQRAERLDYVAFSIILRGLLGFSAFAIAYWHTRSLPLAFLLEAIAWWIGAFVIDNRLLRRIDCYTPMREVFKVSASKIGKLAWWMFPLGIASFMANLSLSVPPIVLKAHVGWAELGIFGAIAYINNALSLVTNALGYASSARLRSYFRNRDIAKFSNLMYKMTCVSALFGASLIFLVWVIGDFLLIVFYGPEFARGDLMTVVILAAAIRIAVSPMQFGISAGQAFWNRFWVDFATLFVSFCAALVLIPLYGEFGAAWALVMLSTCNATFTIFSFVKTISGIKLTQ